MNGIDLDHHLHYYLKDKGKISLWEWACDYEDLKKEYFKDLEKNHKPIFNCDEIYDYSLLQMLEAKKYSCNSKELVRINYEIKKCKYLLGLNYQKPKISAQELKDKISIKRVLSAYNTPVNRGMILCPKHKEDTPSCHVYEATNTAYCFGCHTHFDQISFIMAFENCDFKKAKELLENLL